jgi:hypothetical protein
MRFFAERFHLMLSYVRAGRCDGQALDLNFEASLVGGSPFRPW